MRVGLIDADLLDNGTRHPNLALLKLSGYYKNLGHEVTLIMEWSKEVILSYDSVFVSKVFDFTKVPFDLDTFPNLVYGGTGFFFDKAPDLPTEIEHSMPDYSLYDLYVEKALANGAKKSHLDDYINYSIGFTTRGCFRKCSYCVNRKYNAPVLHSPLAEFYDPKRKAIYLWDDNFMSYPGWRKILDDLVATKKKFQFRQGLDIRLLTEEKAEILSKVNYKGNFIFAFDDYADKEMIVKRLKVWRKYSNKGTTLYVLVAYKSQDAADVVEAFKRIKILMSFGCLPYIMRYKSYEESEYKGIYITLARWCNQPSFFKKKSFREFCFANGSNSSSVKYLNWFEKKHPEIAKEYFDLKCEDVEGLNGDID